MYFLWLVFPKQNQKKFKLIFSLRIVSPSKKVMDAGYDFPSIARDLDWIAVMAYDYHWDKKTRNVNPM